MPRRDINRTIAIRAHEVAAEEWRFHVKQCVRCTHALRDDIMKQICDTGWPLASAEARTRVKLDRYRESMTLPPRDTQLELF